MRRPAPIVTEDSAPFWEAADEGRLVAQRCRGCGRRHHPPRPMCPACGSLEHDWPELTGLGELYSYSILHHPQHPAFAYPVIAALVDLDEGVRMLSNLVDIDPAAVRIGMAVEVTFVTIDDDRRLPAFRPRARS